MIVAGFINIIYSLIYALTSPFRLLPDVSLSGNFASAISTANGYIHSLDFIVPMDTIINLLGMYIIIETAYLTYKIIMWLIKRFPTQS